MNELSLFSGAGGGILAGHILGWRTICAVENNPYAASVLCARQNDGLLPPFPVWDDVRTFNGFRWRGLVDVVSGGFPCVDISTAGNGAGITGKSSGLWVEMARIIGEVRPRFAFVENSPMLAVRGLGVVLGDLASLGYDARWGVLGASHVGAPHARDRMWIVANADKVPREKRVRGERKDYGPVWGKDPEKHSETYRRVRLASESGGAGMADGVADRVDRVEAIGNGQVPQCAAEAWRILSNQYSVR